jgi:hypothetical protein
MDHVRFARFAPLALASVGFGAMLAVGTGCHSSNASRTTATPVSPAPRTEHPAPAGGLPATGFYGDTLTLIRMPDGTLHGDFGEERGEQPVFSCGFLLQSTGPASPDGKVPVATWWPERELHGSGKDEVTLGTLILHGGSVSLQLPAQAHGGCWNVEPELDHGEEAEVGSVDPHPEWRSLRVVGQKLAFHHRPDANDVTKAYLVGGDTVALLDDSPGNGLWRHVQLVGWNGVRGKGWVQESGLLPWVVPSQKGHP